LCSDGGDGCTGGVGIERSGESSVTRGLADYGLRVQSKAAVFRQSARFNITMIAAYTGQHTEPRSS
jgi:hypothetical protein